MARPAHDRLRHITESEGRWDSNSLTAYSTYRPAHDRFRHITEPGREVWYEQADSLFHVRARSVLKEACESADCETRWGIPRIPDKEIPSRADSPFRRKLRGH